MTITGLLSIEVEDITGQKRRRASGIATDATIAEMTDSLAWSLGMPEQDASGRPVVYSVRTTEGEALNPTDLVGDVLKPDDRITLSPSVTAG